MRRLVAGACWEDKPISKPDQPTSYKLRAKLTHYTAQGWEHMATTTDNPRRRPNPLTRAITAIKDGHPDWDVTHILDPVDAPVRKAVVIKRRKKVPP